MSILKQHFKRKRDEVASLVGVYIPKRLASYLSLYCVARGKTKSSILKMLITEWIEQQQERTNLETLINDISNKAYNVWKYPKGKRKNFDTFKGELKNELAYKGIGNYAEQIITNICDEKIKDEGK